MLTSLMLLAAAAVPAMATAQSLHLSQPGASLAIASPCARSVTVTTDPGLSGRAVLDATATHPEELTELVFTTENNAATLRTRDNSCWQDSDGAGVDRTLHIDLRIPPGFAVSVDDSGSVEYRIGDLAAPLAVDASGQVTLSAGTVTALELSLSGSGHVEVARVTGALHLDMSGSTSVSIARGEVAALDLDASGSGQFRFGSGTIAALHVQSSGTTEVEIGATVATAAVDLSGSGDVRIARVTGPLAQNTEGSGQVIVLSH